MRLRPEKCISSVASTILDDRAYGCVRLLLLAALGLDALVRDLVHVASALLRSLRVLGSVYTSDDILTPVLRVSLCRCRIEDFENLG